MCSESCYYLEQQNIKVHYLEVNEAGLINLEDLENLLKVKPSLVSIMHANNEIGVLQPLKEIGELCKKHKAIFHSDIAQSLGTTSLMFNYSIYMLHLYQLIKFTGQKE